MQIKTDRIRGLALNWAVSTIVNPEWDDDAHIVYVQSEDKDDVFNPVTNWALAGPILEEVEFRKVGINTWRASIDIDDEILEIDGPNKRVAGLRCLVASNLIYRQSIDVPIELCPDDMKRKFIEDAGYTIKSHGVGSNLEGWYALLPGETEFREYPDGNQNYLGFFSNEKDLLEELTESISENLEFEKQERQEMLVERN